MNSAATLPDPPALQVPTSHYRPENYDELHRWVSYWYQIQSIARSGARSLLEIGLGTGVLSSYLRSRLGLQVTTFDFDPSLQPDLLGDIRQLDRLVRPASFDAVVAFQVLEHLPFIDFPLALQQMAQSSRGKVILSLPHYGYDLQARFRLWKHTWAFGRKISKNPAWTFDGEHHWEIATRGHSLRKVRALIRRHLAIEREYFCPDYPYHYFFECSLLRPGQAGESEARTCRIEHRTSNIERPTSNIQPPTANRQPTPNSRPLNSNR